MSIDDGRCDGCGASSSRSRPQAKEEAMSDWAEEISLRIHDCRGGPCIVNRDITAAIKSAREEAIEEAAYICDHVADREAALGKPVRGLRALAAEIRALKEPECCPRCGSYLPPRSITCEPKEPTK